MMHANKMILVPHEALGENESATKYISTLDEDMMKILNDKKLPIDAKVQLYNQALRRYQTARYDSEKPVKLDIFDKSTPTPEVTAKVESEPEPIAFENEVLSTVPKTYQKQAGLLLKYIYKNPHMKWSSKGEMIIDGNKIAGSNIVDLINDCARVRKTDPAVGSDVFLKNLIDENIPKELIVNKKRLSLLQDEIFASPEGPSPSKSLSPTPKSKHKHNKKTRVHPWESLYKN